MVRRAPEVVEWKRMVCQQSSAAEERRSKKAEHSFLIRLSVILSPQGILFGAGLLEQIPQVLCPVFGVFVLALLFPVLSAHILSVERLNCALPTPFFLCRVFFHSPCVFHQLHYAENVRAAAAQGF